MVAARTCSSSEQLPLNKAFWEVKGREGGLLGGVMGWELEGPKEADDFQG